MRGRERSGAAVPLTLRVTRESLRLLCSSATHKAPSASLAGSLTLQSEGVASVSRRSAATFDRGVLSDTATAASARLQPVSSFVSCDTRANVKLALALGLALGVAAPFLIASSLGLRLRLDRLDGVEWRAFAEEKVKAVPPASHRQPGVPAT